VAQTHFEDDGEARPQESRDHHEWQRGHQYRACIQVGEVYRHKPRPRTVHHSGRYGDQHCDGQNPTTCPPCHHVENHRRGKDRHRVHLWQQDEVDRCPGAVALTFGHHSVRHSLGDYQEHPLALRQKDKRYQCRRARPAGDPERRRDRERNRERQHHRVERKAIPIADARETFLRRRLRGKDQQCGPGDSQKRDER
jgi:hypothetical protein